MLIPPTQNIVDTLEADGKFTTLIKALKAADLIDTLSEDGPFTLFAPTDEAFNKLGEATLTAVMSDQALLTDVLLYHVTSGYVGSAELVGGGSIETLSESGAEITVRPDGKMLNGVAKFEVTDIITTNGVVHVIDTVLIPPVST